jgi:hypothetical protein
VYVLQHAFDRPDARFHHPECDDAISQDDRRLFGGRIRIIKDHVDEIHRNAPYASRPGILRQEIQIAKAGQSA